MANQVYKNPEPVPPASHLAVLPFLAAIDGLLREQGDVPGLRMTIHRVMSRQGQGYLQQVCAYVNSDGADWRGKVGRTFRVDEGIMGAAYGNKQVWRTKWFETREALDAVTHPEMIQSGKDPKSEAIAYLAIPFLGPDGEPVLIFYADCGELNFFSKAPSKSDDRVRHVAAMCNGFCRLFDWLQRDPFQNLRNFPLQKGKPVKGGRPRYTIEEPVPNIVPPQFKLVPSFNYEAAVA